MLILSITDHLLILNITDIKSLLILNITYIKHLLILNITHIKHLPSSAAGLKEFYIDIYTDWRSRFKYSPYYQPLCQSCKQLYHRPRFWCSCVFWHLNGTCVSTVQQTSEWFQIFSIYFDVWMCYHQDHRRSTWRRFEYAVFIHWCNRAEYYDDIWPRYWASSF